jgi:chromosome segregation ATPase
MMNESIESYRRSIRNLDQEIDRETRRLEKNTQDKRDQIQNQLANMQARAAEQESNIASITSQRQELESNKTDADKQMHDLEKKRDELMSQIRHQEALIHSCEQTEKDVLLPYGRNIKGLLDQIDTLRWYGNKPLGPLGAYVKAKDPQTWGDILRNQLAQQLCSFAVTDPRDRKQLKDILVKSHKCVFAFFSLVNTEE